MFYAKTFTWLFTYSVAPTRLEERRGPLFTTRQKTMGLNGTDVIVAVTWQHFYQAYRGRKIPLPTDLPSQIFHKLFSN